jgi:twitching motility protein PilT
MTQAVANAAAGSPAAATDKSVANTAPAAVEPREFYIPLDRPANALCYAANGVALRASAHIAYTTRIEKIVKAATGRKQEDFTLNIGGQCFRAHRETTVQGEILIVRALPNKVPLIEKILPPQVQRALLHETLIKGGLVVICGAAGHGKSWTCGATLTGRLKRYGGVALTIEDPPELPLHGQHGHGVCFQTEIAPDRPVAHALRGAMRCFPVGAPGILMVGEVRDAESANHLIRAAVNGLLVLTTVHAGSPDEAVMRLIRLAGGGVDSEDARALLASATRLILHQRLDDQKLRIQPLVSPSAQSAVASKIRRGKLEQLSSDIQSQSNLLQLGRDLFQE